MKILEINMTVDTSLFAFTLLIWGGGGRRRENKVRIYFKFLRCKVLHLVRRLGAGLRNVRCG
jgi:hypothetical protein